MEFSISGRLGDYWEIRRCDSATEAARIADEMHALGVFPVHIKKDGVLMEDADEFDRLIAAESGEANANPT